MSKSFLYVGMYYDIFENREIGIKDKKIGITTNPKDRENSLNATKGPIGYMFIKLYECEGEDTANEIESIFHTLLEDRNTHGEWYKDEDEIILDSVSSVMNSLINLGKDIKEKDLELNSNLTKIEKEQIQRAKSTKLNLIYNGENLSGKTAVEIYIKGIKIISDIIGWDRIIEQGECDVFNSIEELCERFPNNKDRIDKVSQKVDDYHIYTSLSNHRKRLRLNRLITKFHIVGMTCSIDL